MYEQYEVFDELEEQFMDMEELVTAQIAEYVDNNIEQFAEIVEWSGWCCIVICLYIKLCEKKRKVDRIKSLFAFYWIAVVIQKNIQSSYTIKAI